jgi:hypothetical protein
VGEARGREEGGVLERVRVSVRVRLQLVETVKDGGWCVMV